MDYNLLWGIYWLIAWFFAVFIGCQSIEKKSLSDFTISMIAGIVVSAVVFGVGSAILNSFIG